MNLENRRLIGFEALLRWQHPEHGLISPTKFLEVAEDTGVLIAIGRWLISEVCQHLKAWQQEEQSVKASTEAEWLLITKLNWAPFETATYHSALENGK